MRFNRALLYVKDLPRMRAFYSELLQLKPVAETLSESWVEFNTGGSVLALHTIPAAIAERIEITTPAMPREDTPMKLCFEVDDLSSEFNRLEGLGMPVTLRPWGVIDGVDPEGNILQVYSRSLFDG